ncbi:flagellar hook protein FlgE [Brevundimonas sp.]|uniref:flagellar hook protein FlgE n=1 Tax=Brevundimonas sp. TaxID=1871086 RepID=UPI002FC8968A
MQAFAVAAAGIADASARFEASAVRTARAPLENLAGETVERLTAEVAFKANGSVLKTATDMYGSLLDILA